MAGKTAVRDRSTVPATGRMAAMLCRERRRRQHEEHEHRNERARHTDIICPIEAAQFGNYA
jgi:hypothetical protein